MGKGNNIYLLFIICSTLLCQQAIQAKPFINVNFFRLTTRAPVGGSSSSSSSSSNSITSSSTSTFQIPDFITPKLRLLSQFLQNGGSVGGGFGFGFKSFGLSRSTTTTTTNRPEVTTEVQTNYVPDSTESISKTTTTTQSISTSTTTTKTSSSAKPTESSESIESTEATESATGYELPKPTVRSNSAVSLQLQTQRKTNNANDNNSVGNNLKISGTNTFGYNYNPSSENEITSVTKPSHTYLPVATTLDIDNGINPRN